MTFLFDIVSERIKNDCILLVSVCNWFLQCYKKIAVSVEKSVIFYQPDIEENVSTC